MERKKKDSAKDGKVKELARPTASPFNWFRDIDRWFDDFRGNFEQRVWGGEPGLWEVNALRVREPLVDLIDKGAEFEVRAELPGVAKEDVDLNVTSDGIEIRAETNRSREEKDADFYFQERTYEGLARFLRFPADVKADLATASLKDGILEVRIPKKQPTPESKRVKVPVE